MTSLSAIAARGRSYRASHPWWFLIPAYVLLALFFLTPTIYNFVYAATDWSSFKSEINPVGLRNFEMLLANGALLNSLRITLIYAVGVAICQNFFGLALALLLERDTLLNRAVRVLFFIPVVMSALAAGYIWKALLDTAGGLNQALSFFAGHEVAISWLGSTQGTLYVLILIHSWKWMGLSMLVYLAGLKTVDGQLLEAAKIDGASPWQVFTKIRLPLIAPAVTFNVATALLGSMNSFDVIAATTGGGPGGSTEVLNMFIFRTFGQGLYAQATTMSLVLFLSVLFIAFPLIAVLRRRERRMS
ncbi:carbohydrate ABC transporter permease [Trueperella pyogenes]